MAIHEKKNITGFSKGCFAGKNHLIYRKYFT